MRLSGGVLVVVHYANGLADRGYRVTCVGSAGGAAPEVGEKLSPRVRVLSAALSVEQAAGPAGKASLAWQMARLVPRCDTIVATHIPTVVPALLARHGLRRGRRAVLFHQDYVEMFEGRPVEQWLLRHAPRHFERVITVSQACREEIERTAGVSAWVVPQGHSIAAAPGEHDPVSRVPGTLLYVGDRRARKGWDDFLAAARLVFERHPELRLVIAAKDPGPVDVPMPCDLVVRPSWDRLLELYRSCHVFVSASWWEGFGRPPLEAMACGAPVVTTDSRGVREYARHEVNCLITPIQSPAALAAAIDRLLSDPALAQRLAEAGRETAQLFTWERATAAFVQALEDGPPAREPAS